MKTITCAIAVGCLLIGLMAVTTEGATLKDKPATIFYSAGHYLEEEPITTGFDIFGYNYQAHMFSGSYYNSYAGGDGFPPWEGDDDAYLAVNPTAENHWAWKHRYIDLAMKWNDAWLSNQDREADGGGEPNGKLDHHYGFPTYDNSGAWLTNHQSGPSTVLVNGKSKEAHWTDFVKIVTPAPANGDYKDGGFWKTADHVEIGEAIWGAFAIVQYVYNDPFEGVHGKQYGSPSGPGFGKYGPVE